MSVIYIPPAGQKRFVVPAFVCINAASADEADRFAGDKLITFNKGNVDDTRIFLCQNSAAEELKQGEADPIDLSGNPAGVVQAELEQLRKELDTVKESLRKLHASASTLVDECNSNGKFAEEHESEVEALAEVEQVLFEIDNHSCLFINPETTAAAA